MFGTNPMPAVAGVHNDTLIPDFTVYTRKTEDGTTQLNNKINPQITDEEWVDIPNRVYVTLLNPESDLTVGKLAASYAREALHADAWVKRYDTYREEAQRAIAMIGERLIQESNDRNWCSEFDGIIDDVNSALPGWLHLPVREREYEVTWTETYYITVSRSETVTARNEEHALELIEDTGNASEYDLRDAISYGNYEFSDDGSDYEATEV